MKVREIATLRLGEFPNLLYVEVLTDEGLSGLGETFLGAAAVEAYVHETVAPYLLGLDPLDIARHTHALRGYLGFRGAGVETRGNSAVDIALWDLLGKATGRPLYALVGGKSRDGVRVYNTCAGYQYVRKTQHVNTDNWGLPTGEPGGPYEDLDAFLHRADELAESLLSEGVTAMKIWPFDIAAERTGGHGISSADLDAALEPFRRIREAVGSRIDIMVELHSLWDVPTARRIARALEPFDPFWIEDPIRADDLAALVSLSRSLSAPVAASETLGGSASFSELLRHGFEGVVMLDVGWCGGVGTARDVAAAAYARHLPVTLHDCTGPVILTASAHLSVSFPNALVQEFVRAQYSSWYRDLVSELPTIRDGLIAPPEAPGLGTELQPDVHDRSDAVVRIST